MGMPVVSVASGGLPIVEAATGTPVTEATNGRGVAVTKVVGKPGMPVVFETIGVSAPPGGPGGLLTGVVGWWDASVAGSFNLNGSLINSVADQSGNGRTMNWTGFNQPSYSATGLNSKPAMVFGPAATVAAGLFTSSGGFPMGTGNTLTAFGVAFMVSPSTHFGNADARLVSYAAPGVNDWDNTGSWSFNRFGGANADIRVARNNLASTAMTFGFTTPRRLITTISSSGGITIYVDGVATVSGISIGGNWVSGGKVGIAVTPAASANTNFWEGAIAEVGVATSFHNATVVGQLDTYLKTKWGL